MPSLPNLLPLPGIPHGIASHRQPENCPPSAQNALVLLIVVTLRLILSFEKMSVSEQLKTEVARIQDEHHHGDNTGNNQ